MRTIILEYSGQHRFDNRNTQYSMTTYIFTLLCPIRYINLQTVRLPSFLHFSVPFLVMALKQFHPGDISVGCCCCQNDSYC